MKIPFRMAHIANLGSSYMSQYSPQANVSYSHLISYFLCLGSSPSLTPTYFGVFCSLLCGLKHRPFSLVFLK